MSIDQYFECDGLCFIWMQVQGIGWSLVNIVYFNDMVVFYVKYFFDFN